MKSLKAVTFPNSLLEVPYSNLVRDKNYPQFSCGTFNLSKPTSDFTYHQVQNPKIAHGDNFAFTCSAWI